MTKRIEPLNDEVLTGLSLEELEDRLEMQVLGASALAGPEIRQFREFVIQAA